MAKRHHADREPGTVLGFDGDLVVVRCADGTTRRWWHHQPQRLRAAVAAFGSDVDLIPGLPALLCSGYWFYCRQDAPDPAHSCVVAMPRSTRALHELLTGEPWRAQPAVILRHDATTFTLRRTDPDAAGTVGLSVEVPDLAPDRLGRGPGTFGAWTATESGAALTVRFPVVGALARHRAALTTRAAVDLLRTALGDLGAGPLMAVVAASPTAAELALPVVQDNLLWDLPGWMLRHDTDGTLAEWEGRAGLTISVGRDENLGTGLRFTATVAAPVPPGAGPVDRAAHPFSFGRWTGTATGMSHSTFLSGDLLAVVADDFPAEAVLLSGVVGSLRRQVEDLVDRA
jgi:hypothetical protein